MPYSDALQRPPEWRSTDSRYALALGFTLLVLVLAPLGIAGYYLSIGSSVESRYALAFAGLGAIAAWVGYETRLRRTTSVEAIANVPARDGSAGLQIPYSSRIYYGYGALMGWIALAFLMAAMDAFSSDDATLTGAGYVFVVLASVFASLPLLMAGGKFGKGHVRLSPEGIYQRGWTFESFLPWTSVIGVFPRYSDNPQIVVVAEDDTPWQRRQITRLWRQDRLPAVQRQDRQGPVPMIDIPGKFLAVDPTLVYHLVGFYLKNEWARAELGTERALRRAEAGTFG